MKRSFLTLAVLLACVALYAQKSKTLRPDTYNYNRGMEELQNEDYNKALEYFNEEVSNNPDNGYAFSWIAYIRNYNEEYGKALTSVNLAIKNLPKKDGEFLAATYGIRASINLSLCDTTQALNDYTQAIKVNPSGTKAYENRAQVYFEQEKYDLADADYKQIIKLDQGSVMGYMGIGRNRNAQKKWDEAIEQFNYVANLYSDYASVYSFRAESYVGKEKWPEATDDIIQALSINGDDKAFFLMQDLKDPALTMLRAKMKIQSAKSPNNAMWPYYMGVLYEQNEDFDKAISYYEESQKKEADDNILRRISQCYYEIGDYKNAISYIDQAIELDTTAVQYIPFKANILYEMGSLKDAIAEWDKYQTLYPDYAFGYYRRGWFKEMAGDYDEALEDMTMSITLEPEESYSYVSRGDIYQHQGKTELAKADYQKVVELEDSPEKYNCIYYAYHGLGQDDKAIAAMDTIIAHDGDKGNYYDAACLYSRMQNKDMAIAYLDSCLSKGYNRFNHIQVDHDMDFVRDTEEFKSLIAKYKQIQQSKISQNTTEKISGKEITTEIPFTKESGLCNVKCKINGLPLYFVFDTGASIVSLSMVEATFMMKNGYFDSKDVVGSSYFSDANGNVSEGTIVNIKEVDFGGLKLENVKASVVRNQKAPLLLGQSVLGRLGKIEIDNSNHLLKITHKE